MENYYSTTALILLSVILVLVLRKQSAEIAILLSLLVCCLAMMVALGFIAPIIRFMRKLQQISNLDIEMLQVLIKITSVSFTGEIASTVCTDSGNAALGNVMQMVSTVVILYLSLPMMEALLALVERILVGL